MSNIVKFHDQELRVIDLEGQRWLNAFQIGTGLGFSNPGNAIRKIYHHHKSEFTPDMTTLIELPTTTGPKMTRIFSARGAALLAMLAKTERAAEFRAWVLDVLEQRVDCPVKPGNDGKGDLGILLTGTQKPHGWDIWPHVARYAALGLDGGEIARLLDRKTNYIQKTAQAMRRAGLSIPALRGRPSRPLLPLSSPSLVAAPPAPQMTGKVGGVS